MLLRHCITLFLFTFKTLKKLVNSLRSLLKSIIRHCDIFLLCKTNGVFFPFPPSHHSTRTSTHRRHRNSWFSYFFFVFTLRNNINFSSSSSCFLWNCCEETSLEFLPPYVHRPKSIVLIGWLCCVPYLLFSFLEMKPMFLACSLRESAEGFIGMQMLGSQNFRINGAPLFRWCFSTLIKKL